MHISLHIQYFLIHMWIRISNHFLLSNNKLWQKYLSFVVLSLILANHVKKYLHRLEMRQANP